MSDGRQMRGQIVPQGQTKLALAELKSVQWAQGQQLLMAIYQVAARVYFRLRQIPIIGWYILFMEMSVVFSWTLVHNLPWPQIVLDIISRVDSITFRILDFIQQRLEWWWDVASVRLMWFRESVENFLDRNLTIIDHYFARLQDLIMAIYRAIMKPIRPIVDAATTYSSQMTGLKTTDGKQSMSSGSRRRNSEGYEEEDNEDLGDEEYLSDASIDTKRLTKEDSGGESYMKHQKIAMAEGKLRQAMYHRVKNELWVMRKDSIRFSRGIVNRARQMVELRTRQCGGLFLEFCQKWVKELGILELIATIQEETREQPFLGKPLAIVRALSEALLASLLRLVRGKKSRRTRSMRSESLRRRTQQNPSGTSNPLPLSPAALQQSSEPVQHHRLAVPVSLRVAALKEEEEDLEGFLSKDSALGSEDNHSVTGDSDQTISPNDEGLESDSDQETRKWNSYSLADQQKEEQEQEVDEEREGGEGEEEVEEEEEEEEGEGGNKDTPSSSSKEDMEEVEETQTSLRSGSNNSSSKKDMEEVEERQTSLCSGSRNFSFKKDMEEVEEKQTSLCSGSRNSSSKKDMEENSTGNMSSPETLSHILQSQKTKLPKQKRVTIR